MPYRFIEDVAIADVAFEAEGYTLADLFRQAALALAVTMVRDPAALQPAVARELSLKANELEMLLFEFLQELIFLKDAERLLFNRFDLHISRRDGSWVLEAGVRGDRIGPGRQGLLADVKAVSLRRFSVAKKGRTWKASAILDV